MGSVIGSSLILAFLPASGAAIAPLFLYAVFGVAAVMFAGALLLSSRLPHDTPDLDSWWRDNIGRALLIWVMIEGPALLGAVAYLLSRDLTALLVPAVGLVLLVLLGPGKLEQA
jgi:hypothetical protein